MASINNFNVGHKKPFSGAVGDYLVCSPDAAVTYADWLVFHGYGVRTEFQPGGAKVTVLSKGQTIGEEDAPPWKA